MTKKKALLVVAGGRATPDVLALYCVQPHVVIALKSKQGWQGENAFTEIAQSLPNYEKLQTVPDVDAYNLEKGVQACVFACSQYPEYEWTFSISSSPKITGIAAYEVAKQKGVPCLIIDSHHKEVISLVKDIGITSRDLFEMNVERYMKIQQRAPKEREQQEILYRAKVEEWEDLARTLALSPDTSDFIKEMRDKKAKEFVAFPSAFAQSSLLKALTTLKAIDIVQKNDQVITCAFTTQNHAKFIGTGDWLEVYVWHAVNEAHFADDSQWGYEIASTANNELDVVLTYQAQLIFAECKTEGNPFKKKIHHLDTISAKANMLGKDHVTRAFVTSEPKTQPGFANFLEQAKLRKIVVFTQEDLSNIGQLIKREAETPTYPRI